MFIEYNPAPNSRVYNRRGFGHCEMDGNSTLKQESKDEKNFCSFWHSHIGFVVNLLREFV